MMIKTLQEAEESIAFIDARPERNRNKVGPC